MLLLLFVFVVGAGASPIYNELFSEPYRTVASHPVTWYQNQTNISTLAISYMGLAQVPSTKVLDRVIFTVIPQSPTPSVLPVVYVYKHKFLAMNITTTAGTQVLLGPNITYDSWFTFGVSITNGPGRNVKFYLANRVTQLVANPSYSSATVPLRGDMLIDSKATAYVDIVTPTTSPVPIYLMILRVFPGALDYSDFEKYLDYPPPFFAQVGSDVGALVFERSNSTTSLTCPNNLIVASVQQAYWGRPKGVFPNAAQSSLCDAGTAAFDVVQKACLGQQSCIIPSINDAYGVDPCPGYAKWAIASVRCDSYVYSSAPPSSLPLSTTLVLPSPTPSPSPSLTLSSSPTPTFAPSPSPTFPPSPSPSPTTSPSPSPSPTASPSPSTFPPSPSPSPTSSPQLSPTISSSPSTVVASPSSLPLVTPSLSPTGSSSSFSTSWSPVPIISSSSSSLSPPVSTISLRPSPSFFPSVMPPSENVHDRPSSSSPNSTLEVNAMEVTLTVAQSIIGISDSAAASLISSLTQDMSIALKAPTTRFTLVRFQDANQFSTTISFVILPNATDPDGSNLAHVFFQQMQTRNSAVRSGTMLISAGDPPVPILIEHVVLTHCGDDSYAVKPNPCPGTNQLNSASDPSPSSSSASTIVVSVVFCVVAAIAMIVFMRWRVYRRPSPRANPQDQIQHLNQDPNVFVEAVSMGPVPLGSSVHLYPVPADAQLPFDSSNPLPENPQADVNAQNSRGFGAFLNKTRLDRLRNGARDKFGQGAHTLTLADSQYSSIM